jgi:hypothetical protein
MRNFSSTLLRILVGVIWLLMAGCTVDTASSFYPSTPGTFEVDDQLKEFYVEKGGAAVFGPAIAEVFTQDYLRCQLMENARICANTNQRGSGKFSLSPLGRQLGIPLNNGIDAGGIFSGFTSMIDQLGAENVGQPLDVVHYNYSLGRVEQYFEKVGFAIYFNDTAGTVHLLPYGDFVCGASCSFGSSTAFSPIINLYGSPFENALQFLGGESFTGVALTPAYQTSDGFLEQVFTNIVVFASPENPDAIQLQNVPAIIGIMPAAPGVQQYDVTDNIVFVAVEGNLGYHIPLPLDTYLSMHGGLGVSGNPITEISLVQELGIYRQCFQTLCLDYYPSAAEAYKVLPASLGQAYLNVVKPVIPGGTIQPDDVILQSSEVFPRLSSADNQTITITLTQKYTGQGVPGMGAVLTLRNPDGSVISQADFPLTDAAGNTSITLEALPDHQNGDLLLYQACLTGNTTAPICVNGSFLIWN